MKIEKNSVVHFHYSVSQPGMPQMESSHDRDAMAILMGHGNIIPGLEEAMMGREAGEKFSITISPDQAYGERQEGLNQRVPRKHFQKHENRARHESGIAYQHGAAPDDGVESRRQRGRRGFESSDGRDDTRI